jgi:Ca2+-binding EF-hand superfamily protein
MVGTILQMLGHDVSEDRLQEIIAEVDADGKLIFNYALLTSQSTQNNIRIVIIS